MHIKRVGTVALAAAVWAGSYATGHFINNARHTDAVAQHQGSQLRERDRTIEQQKTMIHDLQQVTNTNTVTVIPGPTQFIYVSPPSSTTTTSVPPPSPLPPPPTPAPTPALPPPSGLLCTLVGWNCPI